MQLNDILQQLNLVKEQYTTHSFHIGAATSQGKPKSLTVTSSRWKSEACLSYIRTPSQELANSPDISHLNTVPTYRQLGLAQILVTTSCFTTLFCFFSLAHHSRHWCYYLLHNPICQLMLGG